MIKTRMNNSSKSIRNISLFREEITKLNLIFHVLNFLSFIARWSSSHPLVVNNAKGVCHLVWIICVYEHNVVQVVKNQSVDSTNIMDDFF